MRKTLVAVAMLVAVVLIVIGFGVSRSSAARVPTFKFHAFLNGAQEVPATDSTAFGAAHLTLRRSKLCFEIAYSPLTTAETAAHIHEGARGAEGGVLLTLPSANPKVSCQTVGSSFISKLKAGALYINIHGTGDPESDGEIRGQIVKS